MQSSDSEDYRDSEDDNTPPQDPPDDDDDLPPMMESFGQGGDQNNQSPFAGLKEL